MITFWLKTLTFSSGETVALEPNSLVVLLGPNNSGKSTALRNIRSLVERPGSAGQVVVGAETEREGSGEDLNAWMSSSFPTKHPSGGPAHYATRGHWVPVADVATQWEGDRFSRSLHPFLIHHLETEDRLTLAKYGPSINLLNEAPQRYIHVMQAKQSVDAAVRSHVKEAFGVDLLINRGAGPQVGFHVGDEPLTGEGTDRVSEQYLESLAQLPRLDDAGDGLKSYVGSLLAAFCGPQPVLMIDEPEAFLHPPQARRIAGVLAAAAVEQNRQIIVATHSADFVEGTVSANVPVTICRISRDTSVNNVSAIQPEQLRQLWAKPLLRSASAINGMFHEGVIVCESDSDCRLYEAAARRAESVGQTTRAVDLYFAHGGGKGALAPLAGAYRQLGVRTAVIADLDLLRNPSELRAVCDALQIDPNRYQQLSSGVSSALGDSGTTVEWTELEPRLAGILTELRERQGLSPEGRRELQTLLAASAEWSKAKRAGVAVLRGENRRRADELLDILSGSGLFLVPVGELESWYPQGAVEKAQWFGQALEELTKGPETLAELSDFTRGLLSYFGY